MIKKILFVLFILVNTSVLVQAQEPVATTESFVIGGAVKAAVTIDLKSLAAYPQHELGKVTILNHEGMVKRSISGMKGVLLREVLAKASITSAGPKSHSQYIFVVKATDGYTVVFSWNELFNNVAGDKAYLVTAVEDIAAERTDGHIEMIVLSDKNTGRRFVKGLASITVTKID